MLTLSMAISMNAFAATSTDETAYTDSVKSWGAWALDIEPAAGGLQAAGTQPLHARSAKLSLRTDSIAALSPRRVPGDVAIPRTPSPTPVPTPVTPAIPTITPVSPSIPIPTGGPAIPGGAP